MSAGLNVGDVVPCGTLPAGAVVTVAPYCTEFTLHCRSGNGGWSANFGNKGIARITDDTPVRIVSLPAAPVAAPNVETAQDADRAAETQMDAMRATLQRQAGELETLRAELETARKELAWATAERGSLKKQLKPAGKEQEWVTKLKAKDPHPLQLVVSVLAGGSPRRWKCRLACGHEMWIRTAARPVTKVTAVSCPRLCP